MQDFLEKIGLSEKEALTYLHLLKVDNDSIADISKHTNINRTTLYPILEQLIKKDFVEETEEKGKNLYRAQKPDRIESYLQEQKIKIEEQVNQAKDIIPQIKGIMRQGGERPIIEYHEGRDAILQSAKMYFPSKEDLEVCSIYPRDRLEELFTNKERDVARNIRINNKVKSKAIYTYDNGEYSPQSNTNDQRIRINSAECPVKADIAVYGENVRIHMLGERLGTIFIKNRDVADTISTLFKLAFKNIEKK